MDALHGRLRGDKSCPELSRKYDISCPLYTACLFPVALLPYNKATLAIGTGIEDRAS